MRVSGLTVRKIAFQMLIFTAVGFLRPFGSKPAELERQIRPSGAPKLRSISAFSCIAVITDLFYSAAKIRLSEQKNKFYVSFFVPPPPRHEETEALADFRFPILIFGELAPIPRCLCPMTKLDK